MNCRYVARPFAMIGAGSTGYTVSFFCSPHTRARELTRSREQISKLPISYLILASSPGTAALQKCESSGSRLAVSSHLQKSLLPSGTI